MSTYQFIRDPIPTQYSSYSGIVWDPTPTNPFVYLASMNTYPQPGSYLYKYNRKTRTLVTQARTANQWSTYGHPACDRNNRLYYTPPGGVTFSIQYFGPFETVGLTNIGVGHRLVSGVCQPVQMVAGTCFVDLYSSFKLWWQFDASDVSNGNCVCFAQDDFCAGQAPLFRYAVNRNTFQSIGGILPVNWRPIDCVSDGDGNLWVYLAGTLTGGARRHWLYSVTPAGVSTYETDLTSAMPNNTAITYGGIRWFKGDNSLIISNGSGWVKYSLESHAVVKSLDAAHFAVATNYMSFHYPDDRYNSMWVASSLEDRTVPGDPSLLKYFPHFEELRMSDLTIGFTFTVKEVIADYPYTVNGVNARIFDPREAVLDPETGAIWASSNRERASLGVFTFSEIPTVPPDTPGPPPTHTQQSPFCLPKDTQVITGTTAKINASGASAFLQLYNTNFNKINK